MSSYEENLRRSIEIIAEAKRNGKTPEQLIDEKVREIQNLDILGELQKLDHFDEITNQLNEEEKVQFDAEADDAAEMGEDLLTKVAEIFKDPKNRAEIIEELKRRAG